MSTLAPEITPFLKERFSFGRLAKMLSRHALVATRGPTLPPELVTLIDEVDHMPDTDIDRSLRTLVDHDRWPEELRTHPEELPAEFKNKIADVALQLVALDPEALTDQAFAALGRAADDTGDHDLLELALEKASAKDEPVTPLIPSAEALEYAVKNDTSFREGLKAVTPKRRLAALEPRRSSRDTAVIEVPSLHPIEDYEYLFAPSNERKTRETPDNH